MSEGTGVQHEGWPADVEEITAIDSPLGVHRITKRLYYNGAPVVTESELTLTPWETWFVGIAAFSTLGLFLIALAEFGMSFLEHAAPPV